MAAKLKLHLDADVSIKTLHRELIRRDHDVTRTPNPWMPLDSSDVMQFQEASRRGRCVFTFNIRDFAVLAKHASSHAGLLLAHQRRWSLPELISTLDRFMSEMTPAQVSDQVLWLSSWRNPTVGK